ncbi:MAG TPA: HD domain-containing phosphohydrolase [Gemmatimonadaceae bacterium]|nr:HD domain-containing phosphohydrolase [Gemmatimonadaceae bacterium]
MQPLLLVAFGRTISSAPLGRRKDDIEVRHIPALPTAAALESERRPVVIALDRVLLQSVAGQRDILESLATVAALVGIGDAGEREPTEDFPVDLLTSFTPGDAPVGTVLAQLRGAFRHAVALLGEREAREQERLRYQELTELTRVGVALSHERDLTTLLEMILSQARRITNSDAGSLYLAEREDDGPPKKLRFKLSQNFTLPNLPFSEYTVAADHSSLAGYVAATAQPLVIADVYLLPEDVPYKQNRSFDDKFGYRTKSMLVLPMRTHKDEVIGVLQLINRKRVYDAMLTGEDVVDTEVVPYDYRSVELVNALASQAAVAIENSILYEDIEKLFEGFVTAAVTAIESRDPTTSGHSGRVATLTVGLAMAVDRGQPGPYREVRFSKEQIRELRYASLLHDFGKVGVREQVLVKQKKLYPWDLEIIRHRFAYLLQGLDLQFERERAEYLAQHGEKNYAEAASRLNTIRRSRREELEKYLDYIVRANEPTVMPEGTFEDLRGINRQTYVDFDGIERPLLRDEELRFLMIRKGNLDDQERREIESHVSHTYEFLDKIPWTRELRGVPNIARDHHEKLNGRGYPRQRQGIDIPVQTRMMTISDIFDALTATDRPYKRAVPAARALDILTGEAQEGMLDRDLLGAFIQARVYESVIHERRASTPVRLSSLGL